MEITKLHIKSVFLSIAQYYFLFILNNANIYIKYIRTYLVLGILQILNKRHFPKELNI